MAVKKRSRTLHSPEFKIKAVAQFNAAPSRGRAEVARSLGVSYNNLCNWSHKAKEGGVAALYGKPGRPAGRGIAGRMEDGGNSKKALRQCRLLSELQETCDELRKLRENYSEREAMILAHIKNVSKSLDRIVVPDKQ